MCVKFFLGDLNPDKTLQNTYICGVIITPKVCGSYDIPLLIEHKVEHKKKKKKNCIKKNIVHHCLNKCQK